MAENRIKLVAALPKGDGLNGFNDSILAEKLIRTVVDGGTVRPRVALIVYDVKKVEVGDSGTDTAVVQLRRVQPISSVEGRRDAERILREEYVTDHGEPVPYDLVALSRVTFGDLPRETDEIDRREEQEREQMTPHDELRRHLERVHGLDGAGTLTDTEAESAHQREHDSVDLGAFDHAIDWHGWTRADIEVATADSDGDNGATDMGEGTLPLDGAEVEAVAEESGEDIGDGRPDVPPATFSGSGS